MVQHLNLHNTASIDQLSSNRSVILTRCRVTGGVVMDKNQGNRIVTQGTLNTLTRVNNADIYRTFKKVSNINNLVLTVEIDDLKCLLLEVSHRMVEKIKDLLRGSIYRLINNLFPEELPGYFLR